MSEISIEKLKSQLEEVKQRNPGLRIRNYADLLGISELELLSSNLYNKALKLDVKAQEIYPKLPELGYVMSLVRNDTAVHERKGVFGEPKISREGGVVFGDDIDLRMNFENWNYVYYSEIEKEDKQLRSIQFFDIFGDAIQKIYLMDDSNNDVFDSIIKEFKVDETVIPNVIRERPKKSYSLIDDIDVTAAIEDWRNLKDTHDFKPLLSKYNIKRLDLIKEAPEDLSYKVYNDSVIELLYDISSSGTPVMIFVANESIVQIHSGEVKNIRMVENWTNVLDPEFNLHLRNDNISETYVVKKPTEDGILTSLELYDSDGELAITFFGKRIAGEREPDDWKEAVDKLEKY